MDLDVGTKIKKIRELRNFTQEYMAVQLGENQSTYSRYEDNQHDITIKQLHNIASVLDISIYVLIDFDEKYIFNNYEVHKFS